MTAAQRTRSRAIQGRRRALGGLPPALRALLRALAACLALSLSGVAHLALDLWLDGEAAAQHFSGCSDDDEDCPPGCASCHCTHVSPALPVPVEACAPSVLLPEIGLAWVPYGGGAPPSPARAAVYRPPRA